MYIDKRESIKVSFMNIYKISDHLKEKTKDPYLKELYRLEVQRYAIVEKIVEYRIKHKMTQGQLAEQVGVTQQQISKIENGEFSSIMTLEKVLLAIGLTVQMKVVPFKRGRSVDLTPKKPGPKSKLSV